MQKKQIFVSAEKGFHIFANNVIFQLGEESNFRTMSFISDAQLPADSHNVCLNFSIRFPMQLFYLKSTDPKLSR